MIVMHSGITPIPEGWAVCDGKTYTHEGEEITTPNLIGRFIKAVPTKEEIREINNSDFIEGTNTFKINENHLPNHTHTITLTTGTT
jgi:microcystin-dependent protein